VQVVFDFVPNSTKVYYLNSRLESDSLLRVILMSSCMV